MKEISSYNNGFFEFVEREEEFEINGNQKNIKRKFVRRPPGIRAIIVDKKNNKILLSKEYRYEICKWDYRLPGGKVFDSLKEYKEAINMDNVFENVVNTVKKEVKEEVGIEVKNSKLFQKAAAGAGVVWDLFYFEIDEFEIIHNGQELEENEIIEGFVWKSYYEIIDMCINNEINEFRTIGVLLTYILKNKRNKIN